MPGSIALRADRSERDRRQAERDQLGEFRDLLADALIHDTQLTGLNPVCNQDATRRAARAALDLYVAHGGRGRGSADIRRVADPGPTDGLPDPQHGDLTPLPSSLSEPEQAEIAEGCYELLLILAEVEVESGPGPRLAGPGGPITSADPGLSPAAGHLPGQGRRQIRGRAGTPRGRASRANDGLRPFLDRARAV